MHHSLLVRLWKMLVSTKKNLELAKSYTRSTDFIFVNIDFRDRGGILYSDQQTRFWVDSRKIETPSHDVDCKNSRFLIKISKDMGKAWRTSLTRAKLASLTRPTESPVSLSVFSLVPDLFFDCLRVLEHATIRTFLQSISWWFVPNYIITELLSRDPLF